MGQYWTWVCADARESMSGVGAFGWGASGQKYMEIWHRNPSLMWRALMLLNTDTSSLGSGGGDLSLAEIHPSLAKFVEPVLGRWFGKRVDIVGDYTKNEELCTHNPDGTNKLADVSTDVAAAVFAVDLSLCLEQCDGDFDKAKHGFLEKCLGDAQLAKIDEAMKDILKKSNPAYLTPKENVERILATVQA